MDIPITAVIPILVFALGFVIYCLVDLARSEVRHLPKWAWGIICVISVPLGGVVYLLMGREPGARR